MTYLDDVITKANAGKHAGVKHRSVTCADGFSMSVIAGGSVYCTPRPDFCLPSRECSGYDQPLTGVFDVGCSFTGPFTEVEVGFPSARPEPWNTWRKYIEDTESDPTDTVYGFVPVDVVRDLVDLHGGEAA